MIIIPDSSASASASASLHKRWTSLCQEVIDKCPNPYAAAYAKAGLSLCTSESIRCQVLYITSNMSHWRTPDAKRIRQQLKDLRTELGGGGGSER